MARISKSPVPVDCDALGPAVQVGGPRGRRRRACKVACPAVSPGKGAYCEDTTTATPWAVLADCIPRLRNKDKVTGIVPAQSYDCALVWQAQHAPAIHVGSRTRLEEECLVARVYHGASTARGRLTTGWPIKEAPARLRAGVLPGIFRMPSVIQPPDLSASDQLYGVRLTPQLVDVVAHLHLARAEPPGSYIRQLLAETARWLSAWWYEMKLLRLLALPGLVGPLGQRRCSSCPLGLGRLGITEHTRCRRGGARTCHPCSAFLASLDSQ